ncbi:MAG: phytoene/squalene synthase family protein [Gemmobacter sp.]|nr:phytoene/squalene synthase family protein [Gemmobacter sp.]
MIDRADMAHCRDAIRTGSLSFHAASRLLPARVRDPALALYAFCRLADDAVDDTEDKAPAVLGLRDRLDLVYEGRPRNAPADRAFAAVVADFEMPRALPDALLEGLAWDASGLQYDSLSDLLAYCARVASSVGAMMCVLMRVRDADVLARACDLGLAMQLTNIARDVGEDARAGRLYIPREWLHEAGVKPDAFLEDPVSTPCVRQLTRRLLDESRNLYVQSETGIAGLPLACRPGIFAARHVYAGIGAAVSGLGYDSITSRARTSGRQKLGWLGLSLARSMWSSFAPVSAVLHAPARPEVAFLVEAAAQKQTRFSRSDALFAALAQLELKDRGGRPLDRVGA